VKDGFCTAHHPTEGQDMRELGKRGGRTPKMTALRRAAAERDDSLREKARAVLERALAGEQVDKEPLAAARSLFSYRADAPPAQSSTSGDTQRGGEVYSIGDLLVVAIERGILSGENMDVQGEPVQLEAPPPPTLGQGRDAPENLGTLGGRPVSAALRRSPTIGAVTGFVHNDVPDYRPQSQQVDRWPKEGVCVVVDWPWRACWCMRPRHPNPLTKKSSGRAYLGKRPSCGQCANDRRPRRTFVVTQSLEWCPQSANRPRFGGASAGGADAQSHRPASGLHPPRATAVVAYG